MGSSGKRGNTEKIIQKGFLPGDLPLEEYARLQGYPEFADLCKRFEINRHFAIKLLGNGVPRAMGMYVAKHAAEFIKQDSRSEP
jgi:site-specific DNA-cytosine methylase